MHEVKMAFDIATLATQALLLALLATVVTAAVFPLVLLSSFLYSYFCKKYEKTPKFALMLLTTLIAVFAAVLLLEAYAGSVLTKIMSMQCG